MGALAAAGCAWSARGDPHYGGKWAWLARRGRCTASSWAQRAVRVDWGGGFLTLQFKPQSRKAQLWLVIVIVVIIITRMTFMVLLSRQAIAILHPVHLINRD